MYEVGTRVFEDITHNAAATHAHTYAHVGLGRPQPTRPRAVRGTTYTSKHTRVLSEQGTLQASRPHVAQVKPWTRPRPHRRGELSGAMDTNSFRLALDFTAGKIPAKRVQEWAQGTDSSARNERMSKFARAGSSGQWSSNCSRDLFKSLEAENVFQAMPVSVPMVCKGGLVQKRPVMVLFPHVVIDVLVSRFPSAISRSFEHSTIKAYWEGYDFEDPKFQDGRHVIFSVPGWREKAASCTVFADKAKFTCATVLNTACWRFMRSLGKTLSKVFLLWTFPHVPASGNGHPV